MKAEILEYSETNNAHRCRFLDGEHKGMSMYVDLFVSAEFKYYSKISENYNYEKMLKLYKKLVGKIIEFEDYHPFCVIANNIKVVK